MGNRKFLMSGLSSIALHVLVVGVMWWFFEKPHSISDRIENVSIESLPRSKQRVAKSKPNRGATRPADRFDFLRPSFIVKRNEFLLGQKDSAEKKGASDHSPFIQGMLTSDSKTIRAFDRLAELIHQEIDYPDLLIEEGVQGISSLDLYFDHEGKIDEERSKFSGSNRWLREECLSKPLARA